MVAHLQLPKDLAALEAHLAQTLAGGGRPCDSLNVNAELTAPMTSPLAWPGSIGDHLRHLNLTLALELDFFAGRLSRGAVRDLAAWLPLSLETVHIRLVRHDVPDAFRDLWAGTAGRLPRLRRLALDLGGFTNRAFGSAPGRLVLGEGWGKIHIPEACSTHSV